MKMWIDKGDLFKLKGEYHLALCVSLDFALGKGIARVFNEKYNLRKKLIEIAKTNKIEVGDCVRVGDIFVLVTKEVYYGKPTYKTMASAIWNMRLICERNGITKLATYKLGCHLDRRKWERVSEILENSFADTDVEIVIRDHD